VYNERRTAWLRSRGFRVIRFRNHQLDEDIHGVVEAIARALVKGESSDAQPPSPTLPAEGRGPEDASDN
jgi:very-short-patch-repair endonuclease